MCSDQFINLAPFCCPDIAARVRAQLKPLVQVVPRLRSVACGQYVVVGERGVNDETWALRSGHHDQGEGVRSTLRPKTSHFCPANDNAPIGNASIAWAPSSAIPSCLSFCNASQSSTKVTT